MLKKCFIGGMFILTAIVFVSCRSDDKNAFVVGAIIPRTGPVGYLGDQELAGLQLAAEDINTKGGILGKKVVIRWEDTGGDVSKAVTAANKLLMDGNIDALFVTTSKAVKAVSPIAGRNKIPLLAMCSDVGITNIDPYLFRIYMNFDEEQKVVANYVKSKGYLNIGLIRSEDEAFVSSSHSLQKYSKGLGVNLNSEETFSKDTKDFRVQISKVLRAKPQAIVLLGYGPEYPVLIEQIRQTSVGKDIPIISGYAMLSKAAREKGFDVFSNVVFVSFGLTSQTSSISSLVERTSKVLGRPAGDFMDYIYAYDNLIFLAGVKPKSFSKEDIVNSLYSIREFNGVGGKYNLGSNRDAAVPLAMSRYENGTVKIIWSGK